MGVASKFQLVAEARKHKLNPPGEEREGRWRGTSQRGGEITYDS